MPETTPTPIGNNRLNPKKGKPTLLIVEDSYLTARILYDILHEMYELMIVDSGEAALDIVESIYPDLILLDIVLPGIDGFETLRQLNESPESSKIPVIFITGKDHEGDETTGFKLGAVDYITKPFRIPIIQARVKTHVDLKRYRDTLENLSNLDGLTGVSNRRCFEERFELSWQKAVRRKRSLSVIMIDIDYFKLYNDRYGHVQGDECLKSIAQALAHSITRQTDFFGRYGGEEFIAIIEDLNRAGAEVIANKMCQSIMDLNLPHESSPVSDCVTLSLGGSTVTPDDRVTPIQLLKKADEALYQAKQAGRNRFCWLLLTL